jgi:diacylglycerol kinase family enzyme
VTVELDGRQIADAAATTVVVANGQFLRGHDLVPRGHPGDGRLEVQVYSVSPGERRAMRRRLALGEHVPHPGILQATGRRVTVRWGSEDQDLEVDGRPWGTAGKVDAEIDPGALRVLI